MSDPTKFTYRAGPALLRPEMVVKINTSSREDKSLIYKEIEKKIMDRISLANAMRPRYHSGGIIGTPARYAILDELDEDPITITLNMGDEPKPEPAPEPVDLTVYEENEDFGAF